MRKGQDDFRCAGLSNRKEGKSKNGVEEQD
jgi:hypothetical protein